MGQVLLLALTAALNPTLVGASTLMMLLPNPRRLMLGYLLAIEAIFPRTTIQTCIVHYADPLVMPTRGWDGLWIGGLAA